MQIVEKLDKLRNKDFLCQGIFEDDMQPKNLVAKTNKITEYLSEKKAYIYLGKRSDFDYDAAYDLALSLGKNVPRNYQIELSSFTSDKLSLEEVVDAFVKGINFSRANLYNVKTFTKKENPYHISLLVQKPSQSVLNAFNKALILVKSQNWARNLGIMPPNELNSEVLASYVEKDFKKYHNLSVKVLKRQEIEKHKMGLLLSVNRGSTFEPRVVVIEYIGNPKSKEKTVFVGKGITYDSGGYNIKTGLHMNGMKYDMGGAAVVASVMKTISQLQPKTNVAAIMCITDNRVNGDASMPDCVWTSMSGKTVEINNTDAEGRLVMADGLYFGATQLKATRLIDVATLTGAMIRALGDTYTGVWSTTDKSWKEVQQAADKQHELVWRMPFDEDYEEYMKGSLVADLKNTDFTGKAGSCSAAMFLKEFTNNVEYLHFDIAGTCDVDSQPMFAMTKTLAELVLK